MADDLKKKTQEAEELLATYEMEAQAAEAAYRDWRIRDAEREDGSGRQDRINAEIGEDYRREAYQARQKVIHQQAVVDKLKENPD